MKRSALRNLGISVLMVAGVALGQSASIHQQVGQTYNFQPHLLSTQEINQKSAILDQFWTKAKAEPSVYVPALRQELGDFKNPPFFLYDGSMLLLSLSNTPADRKAALAAMAHSDLRDVQTRDYFLQVHRMATLNDNTTEAAFHVLEQPDFKVFIPQHVLTLGQDYVLVYLLLPTDQDYWLQPAIDRLRDEHDQTAQKSLALVALVRTDRHGRPSSLCIRWRCKQALRISHIRAGTHPSQRQNPVEAENSSVGRKRSVDTKGTPRTAEGRQR